MNIYDFTVINNKGQEVKLSGYDRKVLLIVNTATKCGLTPQYKELEKLYKKYHNRGFEILDFPCNQFMEQAPEDDEGISTFCNLNYGTTFPRFMKIDVNGDNASDLYKWLKEQAPTDKGNEKTKEFEKKVESLRTFKEPSDIVWNFGKFLIDRNGNVAERFSPAIEPEELFDTIDKLIAQ